MIAESWYSVDDVHVILVVIGNICGFHDVDRIRVLRAAKGAAGS